MRNWDLPAPELIQFKVTRESDAMATYRYDEALEKPHIITISRLRNEHFDTVQRSLAHEICHMSFWKTDYWDKHGKAFKNSHSSNCKGIWLGQLRIVKLFIFIVKF